MRLYLLRIAARKEGPYSDSQIAQMFADQQAQSVYAMQTRTAAVTGRRLKEYVGETCANSQDEHATYVSTAEFEPKPLRI